MGVRARGLDIKAGAAKLKADRAARLGRAAEPSSTAGTEASTLRFFQFQGQRVDVLTAPGSRSNSITPLDVAPSPGYSRP